MDTEARLVSFRISRIERHQMSSLTKCQCYQPARCSQISKGISNRVAALPSASRLLAKHLSPKARRCHRSNCTFFISLITLSFPSCMYFFPNFNDFHLFAVASGAHVVESYPCAHGPTRSLRRNDAHSSCCFRAARPARKPAAFSRIDLDSLNAGIGAIGSVPASKPQLPVCL